MRGRPFVRLGIAGLLAACGAAHRSSANADGPLQRGWAASTPPKPGNWDADGWPLKSHEKWCDLGGRIFDSNESYQTDADGLVVSGAIVTSNPPGAVIPVPELQADSYGYDEAKRLVDRWIDGNSVFHARFDREGRLIELLNGTLRRWTYDGCARP